MGSRSALLVVAIASSMGCATARIHDERSAAPSSPSAPVIAVPFHAQEAYECGPAALAMTLGWSGLEIAPADIVGEVFTPGRKGSIQTDLVAAARRRDRVAYVVHGRDELLAELAAGNPVIVLQNLGLSWLPRWHYAVVVGHDTTRGAFVLHSGRDANRAVGEATFAHTWRRADEWGLLTLPPERIAATADEQRWLAAGVGLEQAGRVQAAGAAYGAAIKRWPESLAARIGLANVEYAGGDFAAAERSLRSAIAGHPTAAVAWNNLAQLLGERGRKTEAIEAARRADALGGPDIDVYKDTLEAIERR